MANTVDKVITVAEAEVGYLEKKSNSSLNSKTELTRDGIVGSNTWNALFN